MDRWGELPPPPPRRGGSYHIPSFSSTLLDAVCRSIDRDTDPNGRTTAKTEQDRTARGVPGRSILRSPTGSNNHTKRFPAAASRPSRPGISASSSSCGLKPIRTGFSSDRYEPDRIKIRPVLSDGSGSIRCKAAKTPASPGARLASFLNSILSAAAGSQRKQKGRAAEGRQPPPIAKTPSARGPPPPIAKAAARRRVEEEEEEWESDASSDLFELGSLTAIGVYGDELPVFGPTDSRLIVPPPPPLPPSASHNWENKPGKIGRKNKC